MIAADIARALGDALILASEGCHCFPCASSKRPTSPRGFLDATADPIALQELWARCPGPLVGVRSGNARGIDVLDVDRYVIWWPATGLPLLRDAPLAPWPEWLRIQLLAPQRPVTPRATVPDGHPLARLVRLVAGARNDLTYWAACRAGEMVASGLLGVDAAVGIIAEAGTRAGLPRLEAERTARSRTGGGLCHG
jgi:hypothetical protein